MWLKKKIGHKREINTHTHAYARTHSYTDRQTHTHSHSNSPTHTHIKHWIDVMNSENDNDCTRLVRYQGQAAFIISQGDRTYRSNGLVK